MSPRPNEHQLSVEMTDTGLRKVFCICGESVIDLQTRGDAFAIAHLHLAEVSA